MEQSNFNNSRGSFKKPIFLLVGDMVKVIDRNHQLFGKYGLVEKLDPRNNEWQVIVKVGPNSNQMCFKQLRFCTRIGKLKSLHSSIASSSPYNKGNYQDPTRNVNDYIDPLDEDDNRGNR